jgi:hypothetical protein
MLIPTATSTSAKRVAGLAAAALASILVWSCSSGSNSPGLADFGGGGPGSGASQGGSSSGGAGSSSGGTTGAGTGAPALPPETKAESNYQSPVATGHIVWIANPTSGRVAYIDAKSFAVQTVEAGDGPTYLAAVPDAADDVAIVLNVRSHDATLLRDHLGQLSTATYPSTTNANAWAVSADGRWAIAWTNASIIANANPTEGFQDIAVLDLSPSGARAPIVLSVGFRPSQVVFSGDNAHAFAVTQDGISVVDLLGGTQPLVTQNFPLRAPVAAAIDAGTGPNGPAGASSATPDVSFTPTGTYAVVRTEGASSITIVSLKDGTATAVALPSAPTDLTMAPDGYFALAVLRDISTVALLPLPQIVSDPTSLTLIPIAGETIGRAIVTQDGKTAILFTTAAPVERITVLTLPPTPTFRTIVLHAPVLAVFPTADAKNAIVLNDVTPQPQSTVRGAFSIVPIAADLPAKIVSLNAPPTAVALSPASDRALVTVRDDSSSTYGLYVGMMPSLQVVQYPLASPPIAVGIAASAERGYAAQDYPEGRITFVDLTSQGCDGSASCSAVRTITGFELGARVVNGSTP